MPSVMSPTTRGSVIHPGLASMPTEEEEQVHAGRGVKIHRHTTPVTMNDRAYGNKKDASGNKSACDQRVVHQECEDDADQHGQEEEQPGEHEDAAQVGLPPGHLEQRSSVMPTGCLTDRSGFRPVQFDRETRKE